MSSRRGEVVLSGYLTKSPPESRSAVSQWRRRWFVLADSKIVYPLAARFVRFEYYASEEDAKTLADPKGVINLQVCNKVINREPYRGHKYVFDVCTSERVYHLNAENAEEKEEWIKTLCRLLFGSESQTAATGGAAAAAVAPPLPLPPPHSQHLPPAASTELYMSNSTYSERDYSDVEAVSSSNAKDSSTQAAARPLPPPPPPAPRREGKRHSLSDEAIQTLATPKEDLRKTSAPQLNILLPTPAAKSSPANLAATQEDSKKPKQPPPKVTPYKQHKMVAQGRADYEMMDDDEGPPPSPSKLPPRKMDPQSYQDDDYSVADEVGPPVPSKKKNDSRSELKSDMKRETVDDDYSVADEVGPPVPSRKKNDNRSELKSDMKYETVDSEYSYLQASPPRNGGISDDYSHLDMSSASNVNPQQKKPKDFDRDNYSHLSRF